MSGKNKIIIPWRKKYRSRENNCFLLSVWLGKERLRRMMIKGGLRWNWGSSDRNQIPWQLYIHPGLRGRATLGLLLHILSSVNPFSFSLKLFLPSLCWKGWVCSSISCESCQAFWVCAMPAQFHRWQGTPNNVKESKLMETVQNKTLYLWVSICPQMFWGGNRKEIKKINFFQEIHFFF